LLLENPEQRGVCHMIFRFKSRATADLLMHGEVAQKILSLLGKDPGHPGVILHTEMARVREVLLAAAQAEKEKPAGPVDEAAAGEDGDENENPGQKGPSVSLAQRLVPFLDTLERCRQARVDLVWGV
jgi:hypothetical protein